MLSLDSGLFSEKSDWARAGVRLPAFDRTTMVERTIREPIWLHFGAGNIFRAFIACLQDSLLEKELADKGIIVTETFDAEILDRVYTPFDNLSVTAGLAASGEIRLGVLGSVAEAIPVEVLRNDELRSDAFGADALRVDARRWEGFARLWEISACPSLQIISLTITEKGYALRGKDGDLLPAVKADIESGPSGARHTMSVLCALLFCRYQTCRAPLAVVSMDNMSRNGDVLRGAVLDIANAWVEAGHADSGFVDYLSNGSHVAFPWSMIDKITPRPSELIFERLREIGIRDMAPIITEKGTYIAPFVNAEIPEYLVVEDRFPNGRPPLHEAGVLFTDRETVGRAERMKVCTCLNPLHTALAVFGCLLGYERISDEMRDPQLLELVKRIGYAEGLPVVNDPGILDPEAFLREVIEERLPNPHLPDAPQRIATDTSQKIPIRFGETIKAYVRSERLDASKLTFIPLAIAAWLRYLIGIDDAGQPMPISSDPLMEHLTEKLKGIRLGTPESVGNRLEPVLSDETLFGVNLYSCGLGHKIEGMLSQMLAGKEAVRETLRNYLATR